MAASDANNPGDALADPLAPSVLSWTPDRFEGDAPFATTIRWKIASPKGLPLRCDLDLNGDGKIDESLPLCEAEGSRPVTFTAIGPHEMELTVTDTEGRRTKVRERVYSNRLDFADNVQQIDKMAGVVEAKIDPDSITLTFAAGVEPPPLTVGNVLFHSSGSVRAVQTVARVGQTLQLSTTSRSLWDAFKGGFYGVRYPKFVPVPGSKTALGVPTPTSGPKWWAPGVIERHDWAQTISVPLGATYSLELPNFKVDIEKPSFTGSISVQDFVLDVWARLFIVNAQGNMSLTATYSVYIDKQFDLFKKQIPIGNLGIAMEAGPIKAVVGLVVEVGASLTIKGGFKTELTLAGEFTQNILVSDPLARKLGLSGALGYPDDYNNLTMRNRSSMKSFSIEAEANAKLYAKPELTLKVGDVGSTCASNKDKGLDLAMGLELSTSVVAKGSTKDGICITAERDIKLFAEAKTPFEVCPSKELSLLDDKDKIILPLWCPGAPIPTESPLLKVLGDSVWFAEQTRLFSTKTKKRAYEISFRSSKPSELIWSETQNPYGPGRTREQRLFVPLADGKTVKTTVVTPAGWPATAREGVKEDWTLEVIAGTPRTLKITKLSSPVEVETFIEGPWPKPTAGLTATVNVFSSSGKVNGAFCASGAAGFDYKAMWDFARGKSTEPPIGRDVVAGARLLRWHDSAGKFAVSDVDGFEKYGGTDLSDQINFVVTYTGSIKQTGGVFKMRERDDVVEDAVWAFLNTKVGSSLASDMFLEVTSFAWPDKTVDEPFATLPSAGEVPVEIMIVRCARTIADVDVEVSLNGSGTWMLVGNAPSRPDFDTKVFPPAL